MSIILQQLAVLANDYTLLATLQEAYHYTDTHNLKKILHEGKFQLTSPAGTKSDQNDAKHPYYLSMTRSKIGHYTKSNDRGTVFNLNTDHLQHHHKLRKIDYWGREFRKASPTSNEMEERAHSKKPHINIPKPATKLINSIHVLHPKPNKYADPNHIAYDNENLRHSLILAKKHKIPIHVYDNKQHWLHQRTDKAIPIKDLDLKGTGEKYDSNRLNRSAKRDIKPYLKLYHSKPYVPKNGEREHRILYNLNYHPHDAHTSLEATIHNHRKSPESHKLTDLVHKHGGVKPFLKHLEDKHAEKWAQR